MRMKRRIITGNLEGLLYVRFEAEGAILMFDISLFFNYDPTEAIYIS